MRNDFLVFSLQPEINAARASAYLQSDRRAKKNIFGPRFVQMLFVQRALASGGSAFMLMKPLFPYSFGM
jgi:hypothetical protein